MMHANQGPLRRITLTVAEVTPATRWSFVAVQTWDGLTGWGEATLNLATGDLIATIQRIGPTVLADPTTLAALPLPDLPTAAVVSALDQALWDIAAQREGVPLAAALGGIKRAAVPLYANINRRTRDRSPAGHAASARDALASGYQAFKIAPFDGVTAQACRDGAAADLIRAGIDRAAAVRDALGSAARLMIDCHWRLDPATAGHVIREAAALGVYWVECPLPETESAIPDLKRLRHLANAQGVRLAGMEQGIRLAAFAPFIAGGAYDVMMPDVKYVGGLAGMLRVADAMTAAGVAVSPHNPTGPICHAGSLHVCATITEIDMLEVQFDETPLFDALSQPPAPAPRAGLAALPEGVGLGMGIAGDVLARHRVAEWHTD